MTLRLYRGDFVKIDEFKFKKTNRSCWVGPGVYLTTDSSVANSYRTKGASWRVRSNPSINKHIERVLWNGEATDRNSARELAWSEFLDCWDMEKRRIDFDIVNTRGRRSRRKNDNDEYVKRVRAIFDDVKYSFEVERTSIYKFGNINFSNNSKENTARFKVILPENLCRKPAPSELAGWLSEFEFDERMFNANVMHVDKAYGPTGWEKPWKDYVDNFGELPPLTCRSLALPNWTSNRSLDKRYCHEARFRNFMRDEYGIWGFEYNGGANTGGKSHRAFCIWDEDFVNEHRVALRK